MIMYVTKDRKPEVVFQRFIPKFKVSEIYHLNFSENGYVVTEDYCDLDDLKSRILDEPKGTSQTYFPKNLDLNEFIELGYKIYI